MGNIAYPRHFTFQSELAAVGHVYFAIFHTLPTKFRLCRLLWLENQFAAMK